MMPSGGQKKEKKKNDVFKIKRYSHFLFIYGEYTKSVVQINGVRGIKERTILFRYTFFIRT